METRNIEGITFAHVLTLGPIHGDGQVGYEMLPSADEMSAAGVYLVFDNQELLYVGSFQNGVRLRWVYSRKRVLYHFKKLLVAKRLIRGGSLKVFAQGESAIKQKLGCAQNIWVNVRGIEARLICEKEPPWNIQGKKKRRKGTNSLLRE